VQRRCVDVVDAGYADCHSGPAAASGGHGCGCARKDLAGRHGYWDPAAVAGLGGTQHCRRGG